MCIRDRKYLKRVKLSKRKEYEITDFNNILLKKKLISYQRIGRGFAWLDTGNPSRLLEASNFIEIIEKSAIKIAFLLYFLIIVLITEDLYLQKNKKMAIKILGIESSCDETSAAVTSNSTVLSNIIANQDVHEKYGGVVPELASRAHQVNIIPVVNMALEKAGINKKDLNAIAYTRGPGLLGLSLIHI